ncbi:3-oxoacyl-[acyl-carrier-protein] synthase-3 [Georgenia soli]|uniref:Beta-ketoacyl-[acyl-carrier-protein] synthase III n=1 Tax=Georgenia soli TaxID=638953 RepID=A0A2A9ERE1_9MICO|nr:beta-ketoacyl-ACP synthase III [Georgenia soli]PFG41323.1 3-oxoacyl-[acyl-carrier-protein] synthase-3 [Georgenia soli]
MTRPTLRAPQPVQHARILGVGGVRGENVVVNDDIVGPINSSDEWIRQRTGIVSRRRAGEDVTVADLAEQAAREALDAAGLQGSDIDTVLVSTVTWFEQTPSLAAVVADRIGATPAPAYDISAACAGYAYGIAQADALVRAGTARHVLVIGVEKMSDFIDPTDRSISFLLGDGAGAAVVGPSEEPGIGRTVWGSDGSAATMIRQTHSWLDYRNAEPGDDVEWPTLRQEGPSVYKWAVFQMTPVAEQAIEAAGLRPEDIDVFLPHQANMRIIDHMVKKLGLREDVVVARDIAETGNTSAASIPLATERLLREGQAKSGDIALQIGFGAGLAYAAQVVVLP